MNSTTIRIPVGDGSAALRSVTQGYVLACHELLLAVAEQRSRLSSGVESLAENQLFSGIAKGKTMDLSIQTMLNIQDLLEKSFRAKVELKPVPTEGRGCFASFSLSYEGRSSIIVLSNTPPFARITPKELQQQQKQQQQQQQFNDLGIVPLGEEPEPNEPTLRVNRAQHTAPRSIERDASPPRPVSMLDPNEYFRRRARR
jgi:hypothetical protein